MSEENTDKQNSEQFEGPKTTVQDLIQEPKLTWEWNGVEYPLFLANRTGSIGMSLTDPNDASKVIGVLNARFAWQKAEPFIDRLSVAYFDKVKDDEDWTKRENESQMQKNAVFFSETVQDGSLIEVTDGERPEPMAKTRDAMLRNRKPVQSDLVATFLNEFHIERWFPKGESALDAFLSNPEYIYFIAYIGSKKNPRHVLFFKFKSPSDDAIDAYTKNTFSRGQHQTTGDWKYERDHEARLRFVKKYLLFVQGAFLAKPEEFEFDDSTIQLIAESDEKALAEFKSNFNPDWFIKLADELAGAFNLAKK